MLDGRVERAELFWRLSVPISGQGPATKSVEEFDASLGYQTGTVALSDGMVTIRLPESFRFIGPDGSRRLLTEAWGNPAESADGVLGMLIPADASPGCRWATAPEGLLLNATLPAHMSSPPISTESGTDAFSSPSANAAASGTFRLPAPCSIRPKPLSLCAVN